MKFHLSIPRQLQLYFEKELLEYRKALKEGKLPNAWYHLERAHILGQSYPWPHTLSALADVEIRSEDKEFQRGLLVSCPVCWREALSRRN